MSRQTQMKKRHVKTNLQSEQQATQGWAGRNVNVRSAPMNPNIIERHIKIDNPHKCTKGMSSPCASSTLRFKSEKVSTKLHGEHASSAANSETAPPNSGKCAAPGRLQWCPPNEPTGPTTYPHVASPSPSTIVSLSKS